MPKGQVMLRAEHWLCAKSQVQPTATGARNYSQCDSMLIGDTAAANTYPYISVRHIITGSAFVCVRAVCNPAALAGRSSQRY